MLIIKDLQASIEDKQILKGINLTVKPGEVHAIMGPNGSGKSTLSAVLTGNPAYTVTGGSVEFYGKDLLALSPEDRAHEGLFLSFQYPVEIPGVSMVNFMRTALNEKRKYFDQEPLSAADFLKLMREKRSIVQLDNKLASRAVNEGFSGGEKKRRRSSAPAIIITLALVIIAVAAFFTVVYISGIRYTKVSLTDGGDIKFFGTVDNDGKPLEGKLYFSDGATAEINLTKNVINYDQAANIALQDGYDFNVPYDFTAQSISYKRTFEAGWTTLMVPFEVATIPEGLTAYEFVSEDGSEVTFKKLNKLSAFEACLVKVDAAKEYTFTATNQKLFANYLDAATALNFKFVGITTKPAYEQVYMLNADGTKFEKNTNPAYKSFRGCFVPTYGTTSLPDALTIKGTPTGIKTIQATDAKSDEGYYNLAGQRVSADFKGIVIHHGKKMVKK